MSVIGINSIWFYTTDIARLRKFYIELLGAEPLVGDHEPIRVGYTVLVFMEGAPESNKLGLGFDADAAGFELILEKAKSMGVLQRGPVQHTAFSRGFFLTDPDGRQIEIVHNDLGVFWQN
jgi:catechol 2,3-dioxygenase-like lactoylglutathione lyase family enzyme